MAVISGTPDFGPDFGEAIRQLLKVMEPTLEQHRKSMASFSAQLAASGAFERQQETLRKFSETVAPTLANVRMTSFSPETTASWSRLQQSISASLATWSNLPPRQLGGAPDLRLVGELGAAALDDPGLLRLAQEAEEATPELSDEIRQFSVMTALREDLTPELISAGIYVSIQLIWLAIALLVAGYAPLAGPLLELLGLSSDLAGKASEAYLTRAEAKRAIEADGVSGG